MKARVVQELKEGPRWLRALAYMIAVLVIGFFIIAILLSIAVGIGYMLIVLFGEENLGGAVIATVCLAVIYSIIYIELGIDR